MVRARTILLIVIFANLGTGAALASTLVPQTPVPGDCIPRFATKLPVFGPGYNADLPRVNTVQHPFLTVKMKETQRQVLPTGVTYPSAVNGHDCPAVTPNPTSVWAYEISDAFSGKVLGPAYWPAVTLDGRRFVPTTIKYVNELPSFEQGGLVQGLVSVDRTIHWANPLGQMCMEDPTGEDGDCALPYTGLPPAVPHLHGGEIPSRFDGGPEAWFTPVGPGQRRGSTYSTLIDLGPGTAVYLYPNAQEAGTPWFHDHALGATRTNVYSGLAAFYFLRAPLTEPRRLPEGAYEIEMAFQGRQFDTNGQLYFPDGSDTLGNLNDPPPNPDVHPFWIPEFAGDVPVVNGSPWPYLEVEPRRYRFRLLNGANARFWNLDFHAPTYVIGKDDGYLDAPVQVDEVLFAPGERVDVVVDFGGSDGDVITVTNDAPIPYPDGLVPGLDQPGMDEVMQFRVTVPLRGRDTSCDPARGACQRPASSRVERLVRDGQLAPGVKIDRVRQLILKEAVGFDENGEDKGPLEVLVNNTKWDGLRSPSIAAEFPTDGVSELPRVGSTELWEIINLTMDAHPMHTHLVQFQVLNRQAYDADEETGYPAAWASAFDGQCQPGSDPTNPCPGYGPPLSYGTSHCTTREVIGGNPCVDPYLLGDPTSATTPAEAAGWNDTAIALPGEVLRLVVRWAPTYAPVGQARAGRNLFPFDPTDGPGYVWHCHIIDHEDNEMMRPYRVAK
jgi:spore coat protein A